MDSLPLLLVGSAERTFTASDIGIKKKRVYINVKKIVSKFGARTFSCFKKVPLIIIT